MYLRSLCFDPRRALLAVSTLLWVVSRLAIVCSLLLIKRVIVFKGPWPLLWALGGQRDPPTAQLHKPGS